MSDFRAIMDVHSASLSIQSDAYTNAKPRNHASQEQSTPATRPSSSLD